MCVACGKDAERGYSKHPYCEECFQRVWRGRVDWYDEWIVKHHDYFDMTDQKFVRLKEKNE
jgi:hypothetical protein